MKPEVPTEDERLSVMRARLTMAQGAFDDSRTSELDDLKFTAGSPDNQWQWPDDVVNSRTSNANGQTVAARPCLTINKLPQHVKQVTNEQRQNRPMGKVIPVDDNADVQVAEMLQGVVRHIEYISDADVAYDTACENQVTYGEGYIRILSDYCREDSFDQDLKIVRIRNSFSVFMDPTMQDPCGSDANWAFITQDMLKEEYETEFPDATPISSLTDQSVGNESLGSWLKEDTVRIAEYFYYETHQETLQLYTDNFTAWAGTPRDKIMEDKYGPPKRKRSSTRKKCMWVKTNGFEVLEEQEWAGKHIPIIRVVGNEFEVEGQIYLSGLIRNAKDAQRMYNYWVSQEAEMLALAPKAPFIGYAGQFEGFEHQWKTANVQNWPYLEANPDIADQDGRALPLPQRSSPPLAQAGLIQAKMGAGDDIKATTGQYDSSLGQAGNETSGKAIIAREKQGDTGTYHYVDNLARAIRYVTRQLVDLIPKYYDTERVARIIGIDDEVSTVKINPSQPEAVKEVKDDEDNIIEKIYNPAIGQYDVMVTTGPSYMTQRQEALDSMAQLLQGNPELWATMGDLFIKNMDWPGAEEMSQRFRQTMDPQIFQNEDKDPAVRQAEQQMQAMGQQMQQMQGIIQNIQQSMEAKELAIKQQDADTKSFDAETKRLNVVSEDMTDEQMDGAVQGTLAAMADDGQNQQGQG